VYRLALRLYPRSFRREYGDQMVQTLDDLLDDTETSMDRLAVWVRVVAETPVTALRENTNTIGEKDMTKLIRISNKRLAIGSIIAVLILLTALFSLKGAAIVRKVANIMYGGSLNSLVVDQNGRIGDPYKMLTGQAPHPNSSCYVGPSQGIRMHVSCESLSRNYTKLGQSAEDKTRIIKAAQKVTDALKAEGYKGESNGVTLMGLVSGTYEGKDYTPDASYQKVIGKDSCMFSVTVAYSKPAQPAINVSLNCIKTVDPFGKPAGQLFDSSQGFGS
jgi:hypothetical protein